MITTYRQLLTAIHENDGSLENFQGDQDLAELAESAEQAGLVRIVHGWGTDQYYRMTKAGRAYIGLSAEPSIFRRLAALLPLKRWAQ